MAADEFSENVDKFVSKYGKSGFIKLYLTNFLYDLVLYYLQADFHDKEKDSEYFFHYNVAKKRAFTPTEIDKFKDNLRRSCAKKAESIVEYLERQKILDKIEIGSIDDTLANIIEDALRSLIAGLEQAHGEG